MRWAEVAIPAASTFSEQASTGDRRRQTASNFAGCHGVASHQANSDLRQDAAANVGSPPTCATESATGPRAEYPDLAHLVAAWPQLPEAVRAEIVAIVKAASGGRP